jgi:pimeloyl-ACP methyl ester carboxylesterase
MSVRELLVEQHRVRVADDGPEAGPVVVCLHGIPGSARDFRSLTPLLVERGWRVLRIDMPGFGGSATRHDLPDPQSRARFTLDIANACGVDRFAVIGHSFGGATALHVAASLRVSALALVCSVGLRRHRAMGLPQPDAGGGRLWVVVAAEARRRLFR